MLLPIREGQIYQDEKIESATEALTFAAGAAGFAFVDIRPRYVPNKANKTVDVVFEVKEGPRVYVERIDIVGNVATLDPVIRRELRLVERGLFFAGQGRAGPRHYPAQFPGAWPEPEGPGLGGIFAPADRFLLHRTALLGPRPARRHRPLFLQV
jgi:hypothetical protein